MYKPTIKSAIMLTSVLPMLTLSSPVNASSFTKSELKQVRTYQKRYQKINNTKYKFNNYIQTFRNLPNVSTLKNNYVNSYLATVNYYRSFWYLPKLTTTDGQLKEAQMTAQIMSESNTPIYKNAHGLPNSEKPDSIDDQMWNTARTISGTSNLDFTYVPVSGKDIAEDLLNDHHNLNKYDTGHRAWLISPYVYQTAIGSFTNSDTHVRYTVAPIANIKYPEKIPAIQFYPAQKLFPIEQAKTRWSTYIPSSISFKKTPKITIQDLDTKKTYKATNVKWYSDSGLGNFGTIITYNYGKTPLKVKHMYKINVNGMQTYTTKLFSQTKHD